jgi:hypothetical protein
MVKKSSKKHPKQPNTTNFGDTVTVPITDNITNQPAANPAEVDAQAPLAATTRLSFFNFITIATTKDIKSFLEFAATTTEGENLLYLWERALRKWKKSSIKGVGNENEG